MTVNAGGKGSEKYENRLDINYRQALRYAELMDGNAAEVCLKVFDGGKQAVYNGVKTTPSLTIVGTNKSFLAANAYTLGYGRNLNDEDVALSRRVVVIGHAIEERLFPHESPIGRVIKLSGHTLTVVGVLAPRGTAFGQSQDDITVLPITRFFEDFGSANRTVNIATQSFSQLDYNRTFDRGVGAMRIARGLKAEEPNDFEIYTNDSLKSAFVSIAGVIRIGAFVISTIALLAAGIGIMNIMLVSVDGAHEGDRGAQIDRGPEPRHLAPVPGRGGLHFRSGRDFGDLVRRAGRRSARPLAQGEPHFPLWLGLGGAGGLLRDRDRFRALSGLPGGFARPDRGSSLRVDAQISA